MEKEGILYDVLPNGRARCDVCARRCNIPTNSIGFCGVRRNIGGRIYSTVYGKIAAMFIDPIEKKPLFHYKPGARMLSVGTVGCNFNCLYCQNWNISHEREVRGDDISPSELVRLGLKNSVDGITYTYNEPVIFIEYAIDTAKLAHKSGLFNTFVTNGFITPEAVDALAGNIDAMTVDFKGSGNTAFSRKYISIVSEAPIFDALLTMKEKKIFVEITDLIVPKVGDSLEDARKLSRWIVDNMGSDTPVHFLRFHPDFKMLDLPETPEKTLEAHYKVAKEEGLRYVYMGNMLGHKYENTYCPVCGSLLIKRFGFEITEYNVTKDGRCPKCNAKINIVHPDVEMLEHGLQSSA